MNEQNVAAIQEQFQNFRNEFDKLTEELKKANLFANDRVDGAHDVIANGILDLIEELDTVGVVIATE